MVGTYKELGFTLGLRGGVLECDEELVTSIGPGKLEGELAESTLKELEENISLAGTERELLPNELGPVTTWALLSLNEGKGMDSKVQS